jgi:DNA-binding NtrC family response regulator
VQILFVGDDPLIREFVVEALHDEGFHVIAASDGDEALISASSASRMCSSPTSNCRAESTGGRSRSAVASTIPKRR